MVHRALRPYAFAARAGLASGPLKAARCDSPMTEPDDGSAVIEPQSLLVDGGPDPAQHSPRTARCSGFPPGCAVAPPLQGGAP
jgi:hypothetical protein